MLLSLFAFTAAVSHHEGFMRYADISGDTLLFTHESDIWTANLKTGESRRLTSDAGVERNAQFSPDGSQIAFEGEYDGLRQAYVMPSQGGPPRRLTYVEGFRAVTGWTSDGASVIFRAVGTPTSYWYYSVPSQGGAPTRLPLEFASHVSFEVGDSGAAADDFVFTRFSRWYMAWFHYEGGLQNQIWIHRGGKFKQLTNLPGTNEYPVWTRDRVYFANMDGATFKLMSVPEGGGSAKVHAGPFSEEVRELSADGSKLVFEVGDDVWSLELASNKAAPINIRIESDERYTRPFLVPAQNYVGSASMTRSAKRVMVDCRGQIISLPVGEGEARVWKAVLGARLSGPTPSPDGNWVAYVSDQAPDGAPGWERNEQIWIAKADGSEARPLTKTGARQVVSFDWSPDSKWVAYNDSTMSTRLVNLATGEDRVLCETVTEWGGPRWGFSPDSKWVVYAVQRDLRFQDQVYLYNIEKGSHHLVSDGRASDFAPSFSKDGRYLAMLSNRNTAVSGDAFLNQLDTSNPTIPVLIPLSSETADPLLPKDTNEPNEPMGEDKREADKPEAMKVDLDGMMGRRIEVPVRPSTYNQVAVVKDRVLMADGSITYFDLTSKASGTVGPGGSFSMSPDGTKLLVQSGARIQVLDAMGANQDANSGAVGFGNLNLLVEPRAEWDQIYWDAWRLLRDYFYVKNMHGNDWVAIGQKYAKKLANVYSRDELDELIRWMQSELGSSHEYLSPGDLQDIKPRSGAAYLGVELAPGEGGYYKIARILRGDGYRTGERSPLAAPSLKVTEGMYILEIAGRECKVGMDPYLGLVGRGGQTVSVKVNSKPSLDGARTVYVKPVGSELRMRYLSWVESNRDYVSEASNGRVGYIHLAAMSNGDMSDFIKQYFPQRDKEALLIDTRFNNGGWIQSLVNWVLAEKLTGFFNMRESDVSWTRQGGYFDGPLACLTNEFNISCGEEFPHRFRDLGLGKVIGMRTEGGEVGSSPGWSLIDGGVVSVPNYGMWVPGKGWVIEGAGVSPDIVVPSDPNAFVLGKDPQLDAGVKHLLDELNRKPRPKHVEPPDRVRVGPKKG